MAAPRRSRSPPSPNSILDRNALERALDTANISLKKQHVDAFYQSLHRQHYPSLPDFVERYYRNEAKCDLKDPLPLKNNMTRKKNRNKLQLPKTLLDFLKDPSNGFVTVTSTVDQAKTSADGTTTKLAVRLHDGHLVESVLMRYVSKDGSRASLCVSSQVGCAMGCTFCATGTMGIRGNLTTGEILEQVVHADRILAKEAIENRLQENNERKKNLDLVRNVVFMGMGEPLNNYDNVVQACRGLIDCKRWNLARGKVTVSTVGVTPRIRDLTRDLPEISLALSLHAPNQEMRSKIVPAAKAYKIEGLIDALDGHMMAHLSKNGAEYTNEERIKESTRRRAMIEYVMLEGDTSTVECAHQLGKLCENRHLVVNLIPYNQTDVKDKLRCPSEAHIRNFQRVVASYGTFCTIRRTMGADIASACGQLVVAKEKATATPDIEDGPFSNQMSKVATGRQATAKLDTAEVTNSEEMQSPHDNNDMTRWIKPLTIATSVAASCFMLSSIIFLFQKRRR